MQTRNTLLALAVINIAAVSTIIAAEFDYNSPEALSARSECFKKFDANNDGVLSWDEIRTGQEAMRELETIKKYDKDGDGTLSETEKVLMQKDIEEKHRKIKSVSSSKSGGGGGGSGSGAAIIKKTPEQEIEEYRTRWHKEWYEKIIKYDKDSDQKLSFEEFTKMRETEFSEQKQRAEKAKNNAEKSLLDRCVQGKCPLPEKYSKSSSVKKETANNNKTAVSSQTDETEDTAESGTTKEKVSKQPEQYKPETAKMSSTSPSATSSKTERKSTRKIQIDRSSGGGLGPAITH